jgi:hypothetical protein
MEGVKMTIQYVLTKQEYDDLRANNAMLGQISFITDQYAREMDMTPLDCVMALIEREQWLTAKLKELPI